MTETRFQHLHTYFLFPFSIDKQAVLEDHHDLWSKHNYWIDGLDQWLSAHQPDSFSPLVKKLGKWKRATYKRFDIDSPAYQDMVFFHPVVRRVFFDSLEAGNQEEHESLIRCYVIEPPAGSRVWFEGEDGKGRSARVEVTDLRLFLFANGLGVLSIGIEARDIPARDALWINESLRKIYPSSGRQLREGRVPNRLALLLERGGQVETLTEERITTAEMTGFQPPLTRTITSLLYFTNYGRQEFEPILDERMIVYTYVSIDPRSVRHGFIESEDYQVLLSRLLYVDRAGEDYRYDPDFIKEEMKRQLYRRWGHQGTYYGFTSYSNVTCSIGSFDCDEHQLDEGFLIHRMFTTRYYLMALVTLFYRATLLDFAERTALVSRRLHRDQENGKFSRENIRLASNLRGDFLHFSNYWYFDELANKDEENEHFLMQVREYRVDSMKREIEEEIDKLNDSLHNYYQFRNTEAVNRLAMLSMILGAGAVVTGFFGMNFGGLLDSRFFQPSPRPLSAHWLSFVAVALFAVSAVAFGAYVVVSNWVDYRESLLPRWWLARQERLARRSLKRGPFLQP